MSDLSVLGNRSMEYVAAVAKYQSISAAADSLFISQPALSRYIHNLESQLNVKLFNRQNNKYLLTYVGERYMYYAKQIISLNMQLENELTSIVSESRGRLHVSVPWHRSSIILPRVLPEFYHRYPNVQIILHEVDSSSQAKLLIEGNVDCAIIIEEVKHPDIVSTLIRTDQVLLAVPFNHRLYYQGSSDPCGNCPAIDIREVKDDLFILPTEKQRTSMVAKHVFREAQITPNVLLHTRSIRTMLSLVSQGLGICLIASTYGQRIPVENPVSFFAIQSPYAMTSISIAHMKNIYQPNYFHEFVQLVKKLC